MLAPKSRGRRRHRRLREEAPRAR